MNARMDPSMTERGLHRVLPGTGLALLLSLVFAVLGSRSLVVGMGAFGLVTALAFWSGQSPWGWFRSLRYVLFFALFLFLAQVLSIQSGRAVFRIWRTVTTGGLHAGATMALRFLTILSSSFLYVTTTDPDRLANTLIRWGIPYRYGYTFILALRFVPFFRKELRTVREAQQLRGMRVSVRSPRRLLRALEFVFVPVLVSGLVRVDTIAMSMKGRAFGLHPRRTLPPKQAMTREDVAIWCCVIGLLAITLLARRIGWT